MLLPRQEEEDEEEEDPRAELVARLLEYKMYKCISYELKDRQIDAQKVLYKNPTLPKEVEEYVEPVDLEQLIGDLTLNKLNDIFKSIMKKQKDKIDPIRSNFGKIEKEEVALEDKLSYVEEFAKTHPTFSFRKLLENQKGKMQMIVTFLAVLELMKMGKLFIVQEHIFDDIQITSTIVA
jgi:segregation and condensation protein A